MIREKWAVSKLNKMRIENNLADVACLALEGQNVGRRNVKIKRLSRQGQKNCTGQSRIANRTYKGVTQQTPMRITVARTTNSKFIIQNS